jgi:hypothetical protein
MKLSREFMMMRFKCGLGAITEEGKDLMDRLLAKSQEQIRNREVMSKIKNKFALKLL